MSFVKYGEYKDVDLAGVDKLPKEWTVAPLKSVASCNDDVLSEATPEDWEIEYLEISGVDPIQGIIETNMITFAEAPSRARRKVQHGDIVISTVRTYLRAIAPIINPDENLIASTGFAVIRPQKIHSGFLGHLLRSEFIVGNIISRSVGVSYPAINPSALIRINIPIPMDLSEQTAIATFLDHETAKIDELVAEQEKLIELLKEKRQAVISHAVTKGLNPDVPMKDSGIEWLGEVPEHWEVMPFKFFATIRTGYAFKSDAFTNEGIPVLRISDITKDGRVDLSNAKYLPEDYARNYPNVLIKDGNIVMAMTGATIGKAGIFEGDDFALLNQRVCAFDTSPANHKGYLWYLLNTQFYLEHISLTAFGGAQPNISDSELLECTIPVPPSDEQKQIAFHLDQEIKSLTNLEKESQATIDLLKERRSALISAAVTGKIDVRHLAASTKEAA